MKEIDAKKQIEIALHAGRVAKSALSMLGVLHPSMLRLRFAALCEDLREMEKAIPKKE